MTALYNEIDPYAAAWLRNLIAEGLIAPGDVAECPIEDLKPDDVRGYTQFHAYAGIGVWSHSLRQAGWPDSRPCWTFSEPCQPFSAAGKRGGTADERYLRPATHHLVRVCRPAVCFGEQVASKDGLGWLDTLQADMEGEGYAFGAVDTCSAGHGVEWQDSQADEWLRRAIHDCDDPRIAAQLGDFADFARGNFSEGGHHIRQRLRFVAERLQHAEGDGRFKRWTEPGERSAAGGRGAGWMGDDDDGDDDDEGLEGQRGRYQAESGRVGTVRPVATTGQSVGLADDDSFGRIGRRSGEAGAEPGALERPERLLDVERLADADGRHSRAERQQPGGQHGQQQEDGGGTEWLADASMFGHQPLGGAGGLADADRIGCEAGQRHDTTARYGHSVTATRGDERVGNAADQPRERYARSVSGAETQEHGAGVTVDGRVLIGFEHAGSSVATRADPRHRDGRRVDWLFCRDGKWRATRSGAFPLAHGATSRVGRLRAYGNAVDAEATIQFIEAYLETHDERLRLSGVSVLPNDNGVFG